MLRDEAEYVAIGGHGNAQKRWVRGAGPGGTTKAQNTKQMVSKPRNKDAMTGRMK